MQLEKVKRLLALYEQGMIPTLQQHEVNPGLPAGSRENYRYFTLPVCINFQRSSPAMWAAALATWEDDATRYIFVPEKLVSTPIEKIRAEPTATSLQVELAWRELLKDSGINPSQVHPVLWNWSRNKFQPEV